MTLHCTTRCRLHERTAHCQQRLRADLLTMYVQSGQQWGSMLLCWWTGTFLCLQQSTQLLCCFMLDQTSTTMSFFETAQMELLLFEMLTW